MDRRGAPACLDQNVVEGSRQSREALLYRLGLPLGVEAKPADLAFRPCWIWINEGSTHATSPSRRAWLATWQPLLRVGFSCCWCRWCFCLAV